MTKQGPKKRRPGYLQEYREKNRDKQQAAWKRYQVNNPGRHNIRSRAQRLGISPDEAQELIDSSGNSCPVCLKDYANLRDKCIDHCHTTGKVRSVICRKCNTGIGQLGDDLETILRAAAYLRTHSQANDTDSDS